MRKLLDKLITCLSYVSLSKKMSMIFIISVLVPMLLQNYYYSEYTRVQIQQRLVQKMTYALELKATAINNSLSAALNYINRYSRNKAVYEFLDYNYYNDKDYFVEYYDNFNVYISDDISNFRQILGITFFTDNPTVISGNRVEYTDHWTALRSVASIKNVHYSDWDIVDAIREIKQQISMEYTYSSNDVRTYVSFIKELNNLPQYDTYQKMVKIDLNLNYYERLLDEETLFDNIIMTDSKNRVLVARNGFNEKDVLYELSLDSFSDKYLILKSEIQGANMYIYGIYDKEIISKEFSDNSIRSVMVILVGLMIALMGIAAITSNLSKRMKKIVLQSREIAQGIFNPVQETIKGSDEISMLEDSINKMSTQLQQYIQIEYKSRLDKVQLEYERKQVQLMSVQSQINPHFMFNALNSVYLKALSRNEVETAMIVKHMSKVFRYLIHWDKDIITLDKEISFIKDYLQIQQYRFGDEISFELNIGENSEKCYIPKLLIQPLIENACVHGVEKVSGMKKVIIDTWEEDGYLTIVISDNGKGIEEEKLKMIKMSLPVEMSQDHGIGLHNVYQRLLLTYHDDFTFDIDSCFHQGCRITIRVPNAIPYHIS